MIDTFAVRAGDDVGDSIPAIDPATTLNPLVDAPETAWELIVVPATLIVGELARVSE